MINYIEKVKGFPRKPFYRYNSTIGLMKLYVFILFLTIKKDY